MKKVDFIKMHGLGNDFVIIENNIDIFKNPKKEFLKKIGSRNHGIGCDQILIIRKYDKKIANLSIYNNDGTEAGACGNGVRCVASYLMKKQNINEIIIKTVKEELNCWIKGTVSYVNMDKPKFKWSEIPLLKESKNQLLNINGYQLYCLSMGNPHGVIFFKNLDQLNEVKIEEIGPIIQNNINFPEGINVEFATILRDQTIRMKVWERGAGKTLACGSGACATLVAAHALKISPRENDIILDGGKLNINWLDNGDVIMSGETKYVFEGSFFYE